MNFYQDERVALFIDGANLYATAKSLGFDIDYRRLLGFFRKRSRLIRAIYYTALMEDAEYSPIRPLIDWLDYNGYRVVTKPAKEFTDSLGRRKVKGNMDIELAIEVMQPRKISIMSYCSRATATSARSLPRSRPRAAAPASSRR